MRVPPTWQDYLLQERRRRIVYWCGMLRKHGGVAAAARAANINRSVLYQVLGTLGIHKAGKRNAFRAPSKRAQRALAAEVERERRARALNGWARQTSRGVASSHPPR